MDAFPASVPFGTTLWCSECGGPSDVVAEGVEENHYGAQFWVRWLDCGHEDVSRV